MSDYTPSDETVRALYIAMWRRGRLTEDPTSKRDVASEFDRWLAEHDRQVRAEAWGEGWNVCNGSSNAADDSNPYWLGSGSLRGQ